MKKTLTMILCVSLLLIGCNSQATNVANVTVSKVKVRDLISENTYTSPVSSSSSITITPNISGKVTSVNFNIGDSIKKNDVIFTIDDTDILLVVKQAQANYNSAVASYEKAVGGSAKQSEIQARQTLDRAENELFDATNAYDIASATYKNDTNVVSSQIAYDEAKTNYDRTKSLFETEAVSKQALETAQDKMSTTKAQLDLAKSNAKTAYDTAESRLKNAKLAVQSAQENLSLTVSVVNPQNATSASAQVQNAKAALDIATQQLSYTKIISPIDGTVAAKNISVGETATLQAPSFTIININLVDVVIKVTETNIKEVSVGMMATIKIQSNSLTKDGVVTSIAPSSDAKTGLFDVKISVDNADAQIKAGMIADVRLIDNNKNQALLIPSQCVQKDGDNTFVYVVKDNKAEKRQIKVGNVQNQYIEVLDGIDAQDEIIVEGVKSVNEKSKINIIKSNL